MRQHADQTAFTVEVLDPQGYETGRRALVFVDYLMDVDASYGEDADGHRGATLVRYEILKTTIGTADLKALTGAEAAQVVRDAEAKFYRTQKHFT